MAVSVQVSVNLYFVIYEAVVVLLLFSYIYIFPSFSSLNDLVIDCQSQAHLLMFLSYPFSCVCV